MAGIKFQKTGSMLIRGILSMVSMSEGEVRS